MHTPPFQSNILNAHKDFILHGFFTSENTPDDIKQYFCKLIGQTSNTNSNPLIDIVWPQQTHSTHCAFVKQPSATLIQADGLFTNKANIILAVVTADCMPILIYNPINQMVAAIHAGWKGALNGIIEQSIESLCQNGTHPDKLIVSIGPCIQRDSYEVQEDFLIKFKNHMPLIANFFLHRDNHYYFDLNGYSEQHFRYCGVKHIDSLGIDTYSNPLLFSYREANHKKLNHSLRQHSAIMLLKQ